MAFSQRDAQRVRAIQAAFNDDPQKRFHMEGFHGKGGQGSIFKFKYVKPGSRTARSMVVKVEKTSGSLGVESERKILRLLRGCKHIVRMHEIDSDPLSSLAGRGLQWIYLDTVENGTLLDFMRRSRAGGVRSLPNRLLWRIFRCMIRACIAMTWPRNAPNENEVRENKNPLGLTHEDIHGGNLMFGTLIDDSDHPTAPILKLIDFGLSHVYSNNKHPSGVTCQQFNILDMGIMMASLVLLLTNAKYTGEDIEIDLTKFDRPADTEAPASRILPDPLISNEDPCPNIDKNLRCIIAACMANNPAHRPTLRELDAWVFGRGCSMKPADYAKLPPGAGWETDESIQRILQSYIFNAESS